MTLLVAGLVVFIAIHLIPGVPNLRAALIDRLGEKPYRGAFAAVAALSVVLIIWGFSRTSPEAAAYAPPAWGRHAALVLALLAFVFVAAAHMATHIRTLVRHPMLVGVLLWALGHLLANGEVRSVVLFGGFAIFAVVELLSLAARGKGPPSDKAPRLAMDAAAVAGGLVVGGLLMRFHGALFGQALM